VLPDGREARLERHPFPASERMVLPFRTYSGLIVLKHPTMLKKPGTAVGRDADGNPAEGTG
jgi:hypothetical protein